MHFYLRVCPTTNPAHATDSQAQAEALQSENEKEETSEGNVRVVIFSQDSSWQLELVALGQHVGVLQGDSCGTEASSEGSFPWLCSVLWETLTL